MIGRVICFQRFKDIFLHQGTQTQNLVKTRQMHNTGVKLSTGLPCNFKTTCIRTLGWVEFSNPEHIVYLLLSSLRCM